MIDLRCYVILDTGRHPAEALPEIARQAAEGGASLFQLRAKQDETRLQIDLARAIMDAVEGAAPLIVNDRVDVALAAGAPGVHVGHGDISVAEARRILGDTPVIGLTVHTMEEALAAPVDEVTYVSIGGVFATSSKQNPHPPIGIQGFSRLATVLRSRRPDLPLCAVAGITPSRARDAVAAGADGVAVLSTVTASGDPRAAAGELLAAVDAARTVRN